MITVHFLLTSLIVVLIPGTGVIYTVSTGLFLGRRSSIAAALGCTAGIIPHLVAGALGLSAVLHLSAVAFQVMKYLGTLYLLYMAWSMWKETGALKLDSSGGARNYRQLFVRGIALNLLNPKLTIFFLAFLPLFTAPGSSSPVLQMLVLSGVFMAMTLAVFIVYGLLAGSVRHYIINSPAITRRLQRSFAALFAALGIKLALTEQ